MKKIKLYTDGACSQNPGPGGWAFVMILKDTQGDQPEQLKASFVRARNIAAAWNHRHPWRFCSVSLLKIDGADTRS